MTDTYLQISRDTKYIRIGIPNDDDIDYIDINFLTNDKYWGIVIVIDASGSIITRLFPYDIDYKELEIEYNNRRLSLIVTMNEHMYTVTLTEM